MSREAFWQCLRRVLQLLLCCTVALFFVYLSAVSLSAWWLSSVQGALGRHLRFPYLSAYVAKRFDKADKFFKFPLPQDLAVAVWAFWGLTFVASLLALAVKALPPHTTEEPIKHGRQPKWRIADAAYRIAQYELGPRKFWWWWCEGLKVHDALVVVLWLALNVLCIEQRSSLELPKLEAAIKHHGGQFAAWDHRMAYLGTIAGAFGWAATLDIMLLFFPVPRSTFLHWLLGSSFPALIKYHRWLGHGVVAVLTIHGWGFWALWLWEGAYSRGLIWDPYGSNMLSGGLSWFAGAILWVTSLAYVRRHFFEIFYRTHIICFVLFMVFGYMHHYQLWAYTMPGLILYLLDVTFRIAQQAQPVRLRIASVKGNSQLATLQFDTDPLSPQDPIQEVYVSSNSISPLQWHPFTTVPGQQPNSMVSIIKQYGKWTGDLMARLSKQGDITVRVDGPYGESDEKPAWVKHTTLIIFAGGIGVTPVLGIVQDLNRRRREYKESRVQSAEQQLPSQVHLVFSARSQAELSLLQSDIISEARALEWLSLDLYLSGRPSAESGPAKPSPGSLSHSSSESSTAGLNKSYVRHTLPPYHFGNVHWACAHVAAFAGAVLGGVGAWAYAAKEKVHHHQPVHDWTIGAILIVASGLGCMFAAAIVIVPVHILHSLRMRKLAKQGKTITPDQDPDGAGDSDVEQTPMSLPKAHTGRPDVEDVLASLCEQHSNNGSIGVIAAGPQKMVESVAIACAARNDRLGLCGTPYLDVKKYTFSL